MHKLTIHLGKDSQVVFFEGRPLLSRLLREEGFSLATPCGGLGICGRCALEGAGGFEPAPRDGRVLACQTRLTGDAEVWLQDQHALQNITLANSAQLKSLDPMPGQYGLAVDIGTTTLAALLLDLSTGQQLATAAARNPQADIADNVIGRIGAALAGQGPALQQLVTGAVKQLKDQVCERAGIHPDQVGPAVITGNTAMLHFYQGLSPQALSAAPFQAEHLFGEWVDDQVYLPRCIAAFLGADLLLAVLFSGMCDRPETALLADIGTNGELALWHEGRLYCAAAAAGPAFEGGGIHLGMGSEGGAICRVTASDNRLAVSTIGNQEARGICGSGIIDAASALLDLGLMDETGRLKEETTYLTRQVWLNQEDIRKLQLAKGAVAAAMGALCETAGLAYRDIPQFYLAGGFGVHLDATSAARIGLIPQDLAARTTPLGNAALSGAAMLLLDRGLLKKTRDMADSARVVTLSGSALFSQLFSDRMLFEEF